jgi:5-methylcytosine-specific restriction endonuclease McrA
MTDDNHLELLEAARHKSKRDVELLVARVRPQPAVASSVRKLPPPRPSGQADESPDRAVCTGQHIDERHARPVEPRAVAVMSSMAAPVRPAVVTPLAPERYKVQFTLSREAHDKLRRAQDLLRHSIPSGDPAAIFERALTLLLDDLEKRKLAAASRPHAGRPAAAHSRHVPASVRRQVWARDEGRCAFVGTNGRCEERGFLELHHVVPFAAGGETTAENLELRCRAHNAYEARVCFGPPMVREEAAPFYP